MRDTPPGVGEQKIGATWIGGGPIPASKPQPIPASHVLNRRSHLTGMVRGISPEQAWIEHVRRRAKGEGEWQ